MRLLSSCKYLLFLYFLSLVIFGCSQSRKTTSNDFCLDLNYKCIQRNYQVELITNKGRIRLEINANSAPLTASHFLHLVQSDIYKNSSFNRVIKTPFPFIIQGGYKPFKSSRDVGSENTFSHNKKFYIKTIPLEIKLKDEQKPRYNKLLIKSDELNRIHLVHNRGSIAIARSDSLDSGSTQFYIALKDLPELDGRYAVFGKVLEGMNVVDSIQEGDLILRIKTFKL